jgi:hypothetical protein
MRHVVRLIAAGAVLFSLVGSAGAQNLLPPQGPGVPISVGQPFAPTGLGYATPAPAVGTFGVPTTTTYYSSGYVAPGTPFNGAYYAPYTAYNTPAYASGYYVTSYPGYRYTYLRRGWGPFRRWRWYW